MSIDLKIQPKEKESLFAAECAKYGLDPGKTSMHALIAAGSQLYRNGEKLLSKREI